MPSRLLLCFAVLATALLAAPTASRADFNVCNKTSAQEIYGVIGLYRGRKGWESERWYTVKRGQCTCLLGRMGDYYLYVEGDNNLVSFMRQSPTA